jgi:hypothetical protein
MTSPPVRRLPMLAVLALGASNAACNLIFGIEPGTLDAGADGPGSLEGCVLLLHMDEAGWSGTGAVKDDSEARNDGTVEGSATPTADGKFDRAGLFDGNGWVTVPDSESLHVSTGLTLAAWIYPTGLTSGGGTFPSPGIFSKREAFAVDVAFTLFIWDQNRAWVDIQGTRVSSNAVFENSQWYHLAVVYDGNQDEAERTSIYVDGELDSRHPSDPQISLNTEALQIGNLPGGGERFIGRLDEVAIWTRPLAAAEIKSLYEAKEPL